MTKDQLFTRGCHPGDTDNVKNAGHPMITERCVTKATAVGS